jgi:hypothetical protein
MELLCVELVLKRKELLGINNDANEEFEVDEEEKNKVFISIFMNKMEQFILIILFFLAKTRRCYP